MQADWVQVIQYSFQNVWVETVGMLPTIAVALVILIAGFIVAGICKKITSHVFDKLQVDSALSKAGADALFEKSGYKLNSGLIVGTMVKWFVVIVFFVATLDVLNLNQANEFLTDVVLGFLPKVIVATIILLVGTVLASFAGTAVTASTRAANFKAPELLGKFTKTAIMVFALIAALNQVHIAPELMQTLFAGMVFALALALGLAFGLGGRDAASRYIDSLSDNQKQ